MPAAAAPLSGRTISNDQSLQRNNSETGNRYEFRPVHEFKFSNMLKNLFRGCLKETQTRPNSGLNAWTWHRYGYGESRVSALCPYKCLEVGKKMSWHMQCCRVTMRPQTMEFHSHQEWRRCMASVNLLPCVCTACACWHPGKNSSCYQWLWVTKTCSDLYSFDWKATKNRCGQRWYCRANVHGLWCKWMSGRRMDEQRVCVSKRTRLLCGWNSFDEA